MRWNAATDRDLGEVVESIMSVEVRAVDLVVPEPVSQAWFATVR